MGIVATAVVPIVLLLGSGALLRRQLLPAAEFWQGVEWLCYFVFLPALFIYSIGRADLSIISVGPLLLSLVIPVLVAAGLVLGIMMLVRADGPRTSSMIQGSIRLNTYIGLAFAQALGGEAGLATFAVASAVMVPTVNVISVSALSAMGTAKVEPKRGGVVREIVENPLILGCVVGIVVNLSGVEMPEFLMETLRLLSTPALVMGTLATGAAISFRVRRRDAFDLAVVSLIKLVLLPLGTGAIAVWLGVSGLVLTIFVLITAIPCATSCYILAQRMGGDTRLMASITAVQTVVSMATLPVVLEIVQSL
ncbi:MAG TPA: AEC family transporter [Actinomycetales bacterium]|nr:AEC family transporter [Actinomycetales bacterium]